MGCAGCEASSSCGVGEGAPAAGERISATILSWLARLELRLLTCCSQRELSDPVVSDVGVEESLATGRPGLGSLPRSERPMFNISSTVSVQHFWRRQRSTLLAPPVFTPYVGLLQAAQVPAYHRECPFGAFVVARNLLAMVICPHHGCQRWYCTGVV